MRYPGTAVITGGGNGIGRALALRAAADGRHVAITDVDAGTLEETARLVRGTGADCTTALFDVRDGTAMARFAESVPGPVGLVVANAGILRSGSVTELSPTAIRLMFEVNVFGLVATVHGFLPRLQAQPTESRLVLVGSMMSFFCAVRSAGYTATKRAVWALAWALHEELAEQGGPVTVSMAAPGPVESEIFKRADSDTDDLLEPPTRTDAPGIPADEAAARIFAGVERGAMLIPTHDDLPEIIQTGHEQVIAALG
jgi:NAD(P)-dependent dehydrogenase (short-subunit alcohol dehydrogenase family)